MEPKNLDKKSMIYITVNNQSVDNNELLSNWLSELIAQAINSSEEPTDADHSGVSVLQELEYIDSTVITDHTLAYRRQYSINELG